jgi:hypothetical protein
MPSEIATTVQPQPTRLNWSNDQELFYWSMKWRVRSEDIREAAMCVGSNIKKIEACLRKKGWLR